MYRKKGTVPRKKGTVPRKRIMSDGKKKDYVRTERPSLKRCYGFFHCRQCDNTWRSAYVYVIKGTKKVYFKQGCNACKIFIFPFRTEELKCPKCDQPRRQCQCVCDICKFKVSMCICKCRNCKFPRPNCKCHHQKDLCQACRAGLCLFLKREKDSLPYEFNELKLH